MTDAAFKAHSDEFARAFGVEQDGRANLLDEPGFANVSLGRSGARKLRSIAEGTPRVVVLLRANRVGWSGVLRAIGDDDEVQKPLPALIGELVVVDVDLEWAFVISEHLGHGLLQPPPFGSIKGKMKL